ncbi:LysR family transcriptional regulator [Lautropia dentalis]|uniref:LysR family transcriptional regulator n=1 Tax=Lautropia dentalis TaxID=2490857 RepID=A0A426FLM0_9BURK|nr:LysR family transcriptional regulator [Lautropia dentalis]RRN43654.1 LysR family transcriptional regulator [Lautropia dentalis]
MTDNRNFNDLYAFTQVIRQGNYSRAARVLNVQPSALSHRMAELEKRLGIRLINRTTRAMSPTEAGQQLFEHIAPSSTASSAASMRWMISARPSAAGCASTAQKTRPGTFCIPPCGVFCMITRM